MMELYTMGPISTSTQPLGSKLRERRSEGATTTLVRTDWSSTTDSWSDFCSETSEAVTDLTISGGMGPLAESRQVSKKITV